MIRTDIAWIVCLLFFSANAQTPVTVQPAFPSLLPIQNIRDLTMSRSGSEAYITVQSPLGEISVLARLQKSNGKWGDPELLSFSGKYKDLEPALSPDGLRLYFVSNRPLRESDTEPKDYDIWFVERQGMDAPWGEPVNLGPPVNTEHNEFFPSLAINNNLYFTSDHPDSTGKDDIFFSAWKGGQYVQPVPLSNSINTEGYEFNAFIAPDESYLIFSGYNRQDGYGSADLYVSFRQDNTWQPALNLGGSVNSAQMDYCPFVDPGSVTLYFTSKRSNLKETNDFKALGEVLLETGRYDNGWSRIYKVELEKVMEDLQTQTGR